MCSLGTKQERTPTWYGMFLSSRRATETVDVMEYIWTGAGRKSAARTERFMLDEKTVNKNVRFEPRSNCTARVLRNRLPPGR